MTVSETHANRSSSVPTPRSTMLTSGCTGLRTVSTAERSELLLLLPPLPLPLPIVSLSLFFVAVRLSVAEGSNRTVRVAVVVAV